MRAFRVLSRERGFAARLGLAFVPVAVPWALEWIFDWRPNCFFNDSWYCIYYFHPPIMDVLFGLLVLAPFITTERLWLPRVLGLVSISIFVHAASVEFLIGTRGSIAIAGVDSIFLNVFPIAVIASLIVATVTAWIAKLQIRARFWPLSVAAGLSTAAALILTDLINVPAWVRDWSNEPWLLWHISMCAAIYFGTWRTGKPAISALASS